MPNTLTAAEIEAQRVAEIRRKIAELEAKKDKYESAKERVENVQKTCRTENSNWSSKIKVFSNQINEVVKMDLFEGEIAEQLKKHASSLKGSMNNGVASANALCAALGSQIAKIQTKIDEYDRKIAALRSQI